MKKAPERGLVGSLMDRLVDGPKAGQARFAGQQLPELKLSVSRDLEHLLNTRRRCLDLPPQCQDLAGTLIEYGIPDFTGLNMSVPGKREEIRQEIERVIRRFEPRLTNVAVIIQTNVEPWDRTLRLRITGKLQVKPLTENLVFDSQLRPSTGTIEVKAVP